MVSVTTTSQPSNRSIARSIAAAASGRPAPRYAPTGVVLVSTAVAIASARGMLYGPGAIRIVSDGRNAPIFGYAPQSWTICSR